MSFTLSAVPEIHYGADILESIADHAMRLCEGGKALIVIDSFLNASGLGERVRAKLQGAGIPSAIFSDFSGEPKVGHLRAASAVAAGRQLVIGIGGGSALDIAKIVACTAASGDDPMHYALAANPLPRKPLRKIMVPTTAGTGSETSATNIFAGPEGKKLWIWGPETKADVVLLDPSLTVSLPKNLTAWCGMDAFIHAFEASTNRNTHPAAQLFGHKGMRLVAEHLETAVRVPDDMQARGAVLLGSCYAGIAIDNCGTAIAHNISHALAGLAPIHHGQATALGFEATLPWLVEMDSKDIRQAASALGLGSSAELPAFVSRLMDHTGIERRLPARFADYTPLDLAGEMGAPENRPMRSSTIRDVTDTDIENFAVAVMALEKDAA